MLFHKKRQGIKVGNFLYEEAAIDQSIEILENHINWVVKTSESEQLNHVQSDIIEGITFVLNSLRTIKINSQPQSQYPYYCDYKGMICQKVHKDESTYS